MKNVSKNDVLIDWFEFTIKGISFRKLLNDLNIPYDEIKFFNTGMLFYNLTAVYKEKIKFLLTSEDWNEELRAYNIQSDHSHDRQGIHVILSGYACREWEMFNDFNDLMIYAYNNASSISRIDIAFDLFTKELIDLKTIIHYVRSGRVVSKAKTALIFDKRTLKSGDNCGYSIRIGSSASESMIMIYDKLEERKQADYKVDSSVKVWNRIELRLRRDTAYKFLQQYFETYDQHLGLIAIDVLNNLISFKDFESSDSNRSRSGNAYWWDEFIKDSKKLELSKKAIQSSIQSKKEWVEKSVLKSVSSVLLCNVDDLLIDDIVAYFMQGVQKLNSMDLEAINTYRIDKKGSIITQQDLDKIKNKVTEYLKTNR